MLMKVVFPAPLVPIRPTTESFSIAALTSCAAVTAPKLLHSPRASRMAGIASRKQGPETFWQEHDDDQERQPEGHLPGVGRKVVGGRVDRAVEERPGERRDHIACSREDRDEDEFARRGPERH